MTIQHQPSVTKAFLWFPCVCKQHEQRLDWIATDKTTRSHLCVPLPHAPRLSESFCRYMGSAHIGRNCTSLRRTLTRIAQPLPRKLPHHRPLENTKAHKEDKIQPGGQPQLCPLLESPTSSPRWTSLWQPGSTDLYASLHPRIHTSMYLCIHASMNPACKRCREHGWPSANGHVCGEHSSPLSSPRGLPSSHLLASLSSHSTCRTTVPHNRLQNRGK